MRHGDIVTLSRTTPTLYRRRVAEQQQQQQRELLEGQSIAGRYVIKRKLGAGGMGDVYVAEQQPLGREVALKIVRGDLANEPRAVERFRREAKTLSALVHPHIVSLYDFGETDQGLFFAMELLPGHSLRQRFQQRPGGPVPMTVSESLPIVRDICAALGAAHARGVLHRDLKPDNVMLIEAFGRKDFVKLLDFGIAKLVDKEGEQTHTASLTQAGMLVGTPGYLAPEVVVDGVLDDCRSDLYALGVTWFEMITGQAPFTAATPVGLMMKHAHEKAPRTTDLIDGVPPGVADLLDELLAKDRRQRPPDAQAVLARLEALGKDGTGTGASAPKPAAPGAAGASGGTQKFVLPPTRGSAPTADGTSPFLDRPAPTLETPASTAVLPELARLDLAPLPPTTAAPDDAPPASSSSLPLPTDGARPLASRVPRSVLIAAAAVVVGVVVAGIVAFSGDDGDTPDAARDTRADATAPTTTTNTNTAPTTTATAPPTTTPATALTTSPAAATSAKADATATPQTPATAPVKSTKKSGSTTKKTATATAPPATTPVETKKPADVGKKPEKPKLIGVDDKPKLLD